MILELEIGTNLFWIIIWLITVWGVSRVMTAAM